MNLTKALSWARVVIVAIPLFGIVSAAQLGCEAATADDVSSQGGASSKGKKKGSYGYASDGYGEYYGDGDSWGYDGYGGSNGYDGYP